jgi:uncharacterized protein (DUF433 family)
MEYPRWRSKRMANRLLALSIMVIYAFSKFAKRPAAASGIRRGMNDRIVIDPKVCHGKPVVRGTRMPVSLIVGSLAGGMSFEDVQREYALTLEDIRAALKFAGELVEQEQYHPLPG